MSPMAVSGREKILTDRQREKDKNRWRDGMTDTEGQRDRKAES